MSFLTTLRSGFTSAASRRAVTAPARTAAEESRAALLERLYRDHADRIYGLCLRMSGDRVRATELAQDVFVRAWEQLDRLRSDGDAGAWLWRLATNVVLNAMRAERRRHARVAPVAEPALLERAQLGTPLPVRRLSLDAAIAGLPGRAREVFVLHDVEGFAGPEIAEMLGVAEGTVRAHLHRARALMRETLR
ncbi:MAG TPA: RNA polymerase sigma factor [Gemmatimonadaceae bacterium]|nr:RNA polymerase sigma factor [Gemmatimonadaceae bacterium]